MRHHREPRAAGPAVASPRRPKWLIRTLAASVLALTPAGWSQETAAPRPPAPVIAGRVLHSAGNPVCGALISVKMDNWRAREAFAPFYDYETEGKTADDGRFAIPVPVPGDYDVAISAPGFAPLAGSWTANGGGVVRLTIGGGIRGRVVEKDGGVPIPGATVSIAWYGGPKQITTDHQGRFLFDHVPPGKARLWAEHETHVPSQRLEPMVEDGVVVVQEFQLERGRTVAGSVVDVKARPVAGATVSMEVSSNDSSLIADCKKVSVADTEGRFELRGVQPAGVSLHFRAAGFAPSTKQIDLSLQDAVGPVTLESGVTLRGVVRDRGGHTVEGAEIKAFKKNISLSDIWIEHLVTTSESDGRFVLRDLPPPNRFNDLVLRARHPAFADAYVPVAQLISTEQELAFRLSAGGSIAGLLAGPDGIPLARARVELFERLAGDAFWPGRVTGSDARGRFCFDHLPPGAYELHALARGMLVSRVELDLAHEGARVEPQITMVSGNALVGTVTDPSGKPVAAEVQVWNDHGNATATTDVNGHFRVQAMDDGPWSIHVRADGFIDRSFENVAREPDGRVRLVVEPAMRISLRIVDAATKAPIPGAEVRIADAQGYGWTHVADEDGRFDHEVEERTFSAMIGKTGYASVRKRDSEMVALPGRLPVVVELAPGGGIAGTLPDVPLHGVDTLRDGCEVLARTAGAEVFEVVGRSDREGRFRIQGLKPGLCDVTGRVPRCEDPTDGYLLDGPPINRIPPIASGVRVKAGETTTVTFPAADLTPLKVRCALPRPATPGPVAMKEPVPALVVLESLDGATLELVAEKDGTFLSSPCASVAISLFHGVAYPRLALPPGRYRIRLTSEGLRTSEAEIELRPGAPAYVRLQLEPVERRDK